MCYLSFMRFLYIMLMLCLFWQVLPASASAELPFALPGEGFEPAPLPDSTFYNEYGHELSFDDFRGKVVLINFWATWCTPCVKEMPSLNALQKKFPWGLKVLAISQDTNDPLQTVRQFYDQNRLYDLDIYYDGTGKLFHSFGLTGIPATIILNRKGEEVARVGGYVDWEQEDIKDFVRRLTRQR